MDIIRNSDGTLVVPLPTQRHESDDDIDTSSGTEVAARGDQTEVAVVLGTRLLHPGEGGYDAALVEWDLQQNPDRAPVVSTVTGREEAMTIVHAVAISPDHSVTPALEALHDPQASGEALRHILVGGVHSIEDFSAEVADAEGDDPLPAHQMTKIIGEVIAELDG